MFYFSSDCASRKPSEGLYPRRPRIGMPQHAILRSSPTDFLCLAIYITYVNMMLFLFLSLWLTVLYRIVTPIRGYVLENSLMKLISVNRKIRCSRGRDNCGPNKDGGRICGHFDKSLRHGNPRGQLLKYW